MWLFQPLCGEITNKQIWLWWEKRRLFYNGMVIVIALVSFTAYAYFLVYSGHLRPGEDLIEPIAILAGVTVAPVVWNLAYFLGPIADIFIHSVSGKTRGPVLLGLGLLFSVGLVSFPALYWATVWAKHLLN